MQRERLRQQFLTLVGSSIAQPFIRHFERSLRSEKSLFVDSTCASQRLILSVSHLRLFGVDSFVLRTQPLFSSVSLFAKRRK